VNYLQQLKRYDPKNGPKLGWQAFTAANNFADAGRTAALPENRFQTD
jgi:hypothetical protein